MSTHGAYGFKVDGKYVIIYNHFDSYLEGGLGEDVFTFIKYVLLHNQVNQLKEAVNKLEFLYSNDIDEDDGPINILNSILNGEINGVVNRFDFLKNSLFCSYAYIINLDENRLEIYKGGSKEFDKNSPLPFLNEDKYGEWFPVKFVCSYDFDKWPEDFEEVVKDFTFKIQENIV